MPLEPDTATGVLDELLKDAPALQIPRPTDDDDVDEDPRWLGYWLVSMAQETRRVVRHSSAPADAPAPSSLVRQLEDALTKRPTPDDTLGQLAIDPASVARRAAVIAAYVARAPGPIVAVGDDDGVSLALALLGLADVHAVDLDPRVLAFLDEAAARFGVSIGTHRADVFEDVVPEALRHRAAGIVTDPFRSAADAAPFIAYGLAMMRKNDRGWLFYCDHPSWSFDHETTHTMIQNAGLASKAHKRALHRYPITRASFPRLAETAQAIDVPVEWLGALVDATAGWSDLHVYERPPA